MKQASNLTSELNGHLISAFFQHASLAIRLKHDGTGMPNNLPAALLLGVLFMVFSLLNQQVDGLTLDTILKVGFIAQCYILFLRNQLVGLIILISIVCNAFAFGLTNFMGIAKEQLYLLLIAEYMMVTAAILNVVKKTTKVI